MSLLRQRTMAFAICTSALFPIDALASPTGPVDVRSSPVLEEIEASVPPFLTTRDAITQYMLDVVIFSNDGDNVSTVREIQLECGLPSYWGTLGPKTLLCIEERAAAIAEQRRLQPDPILTTERLIEILTIELRARLVASGTR